MYFGTIDTNGIVSLTWKKNSGADILGYMKYILVIKVIMCFAALTNSGLNDSYTDTIMVRTLTEHIIIR